jgi:uncharacterized protein YdeI (YjbR/CyaY-like superfamily)
VKRPPADKREHGSAAAPIFFASAAKLRSWLVAHHDRADALWIGFWKAHTGREELTYAQAVDEALCFGWIDGLKKRLDDDAFVQRFTPRRARSIWSAINLERVARLAAAGRMAPPGIAAHAGRDPKRAGLYSFENRGKFALTPAFERRFRAERAAWRWFGAQPPSYRHVAVFWVMSAKRGPTRERRLARLIADSAAEQRLAHLVPSGRARR